MPGRADQVAVLRGQRFLTLAMAKGDEPYLVSLNYAFDEAGNCFYVHCAGEGKKLDFLRANPRVWGQVIEDRGYVEGNCSHAYRSVMFKGRAEFIDRLDEKRQALSLMIDHADSSPQELKQRLLADAQLRTVIVMRLRVDAMSGKCGW